MVLKGSRGQSDQALDLGSQTATVLFGQGQGTPRRGIGIGTAANGHKADRTRMLVLDGRGSHSGPVTMGGVELAAQGRAMAGIAGEDCDQGPVFGGGPQYRDGRINGSTGSASIPGEIGSPLPPSQTGGPPGLHRSTDRRDCRIHEQARVGVYGSLILGRDFLGEDVGSSSAQAGGAVSVRHREGDPFSKQAVFPRQSSSDHLGDAGGQDAIVEGHNHTGRRPFAKD